MTINFILSHPAVPENIGFSLRALKVMGFTQLRLVNPPKDFLAVAKKTAYGSHDLLESSEVFATLEEAIADMDIVIGTTAKNRMARHEYLEPYELKSILQEKESILKNVGLVFGSEQNGLSKEEIMKCDLLSTIPLATSHPSLNLAQSVLIYAYELAYFPQQKFTENHSPDEITSPQKELKTKALDVLATLDVARQPSLYHRIKDRLMTASAEDTQLMLAFAKFLQHQEKGNDGK